MMMTTTDTLYVCECCMMLAVNDDDTACRDYYGHDHAAADLPAGLTFEGEDTTASAGELCDGCGQSLPAMARLYHFETL